MKLNIRLFLNRLCKQPIERDDGNKVT